jgi:HAD superfamily hydrolase (TIGR01509 family)
MTAVLQFVPHGQAVEAVLFDLDGTLLDSHGALESVFWRFLGSHGIARGDVDIGQFDGLTIPEIVATLRTHWSLASDENSLVATYVDAIRSAYADQVSPFNGADAMLRRLHGRGTKLALVTAATSTVLTPLLERLAWSALLEELKMSPARAIAIEDSRHGVAAAREAGLRVIGIAPPERAAVLTAAGATVVLPSVAAISNVLQSGEACHA